jgi:hypothetical protein
MERNVRHDDRRHESLHDAPMQTWFALNSSASTVHSSLPSRLLDRSRCVMVGWLARAFAMRAHACSEAPPSRALDRSSTSSVLFSAIPAASNPTAPARSLQSSPRCVMLRFTRRSSATRQGVSRRVLLLESDAVPRGIS